MRAYGREQMALPIFHDPLNGSRRGGIEQHGSDELPAMVGTFIDALIRLKIASADKPIP